MVKSLPHRRRWIPLLAAMTFALGCARFRSAPDVVPSRKSIVREQ